MKKILGLLAVTASAFALTACFESNSSNGSQQIAFRSVPLQGSYADNNDHAVHSVDDQEGPIDTRFSVQFTANEEIIVTDSTLNKTYTFTSDQVQGGSFHPMDFMSVFATQLDNRADVGPEPDWNDPVAVDAYFDQIEAVYVLTPTATNGNEYALARISTRDGQQWLLVGDPTSTVLAGNATYSGGYYTAGPNAAQGAMEMSANFAGNVNAIDITLHKPDLDAANAIFGANTATFSADFNSATNTIEGAGKAVGGGGFYDTADIHGAFFNGGNAAAGLLRLEGAGAPGDNYGGFHVIKD